MYDHVQMVIAVREPSPTLTELLETGLICQGNEYFWMLLTLPTCAYGILFQNYTFIPVHISVD